MTELQELEARILDVDQQLTYARAAGNQERVSYLEGELSAMLRDLDAATGRPAVQPKVRWSGDPDWWPLVTGE